MYENISHQIAERMALRGAPHEPPVLFHAADTVTRMLLGDPGAHAEVLAAGGDPAARELYGRAHREAYDNPLFWTTYYKRDASLRPLRAGHPWANVIRRGFEGRGRLGHRGARVGLAADASLTPWGTTGQPVVDAGQRMLSAVDATHHGITPELDRALHLATRTFQDVYNHHVPPFTGGIPLKVDGIFGPLTSAAVWQVLEDWAEATGEPVTTSGGPWGEGGRHLGHPAGWRWGYHYGEHNPAQWSGPRGLGVDYLQAQEAAINDHPPIDDGEPEWPARHRGRHHFGD